MADSDLESSPLASESPTREVDGLTSDEDSVMMAPADEEEDRQSFIASGYPVTLWVEGQDVKPGLVDTVSFNMKHMLNALGVPAVAMLYYRMKSSAVAGESSHLFVAVDDTDHVIRIPSARLAMLTSTIDAVELAKYTGAITADPLGALLLRLGSGNGVRINRFPPIFGFKTARGEKMLYDRRPELSALRRDGYVGLTFLPVAGVDHRIELMTEIASLWGYSVAYRNQQWPDLLVLRNDTPEREDLGGVPDESWLNHALARVQEDHLPIVEIDGVWMGTLRRNGAEHRQESRARVIYAVLDWFRLRQLPYITARTFHCYVRRDFSAIVALGSLRDRMELIAFLEVYPFDSLVIQRVKGEVAAAQLIYQDRTPQSVGKDQFHSIGIKDGDAWLVVSAKPVAPKEKTQLESTLRRYYSGPACAAPGSQLSKEDVSSLPLASLLKVVRLAECEAAGAGQCLIVGQKTARPDLQLPSSWTISHRAYRAAVRSHKLRSHDVLGVYRVGPYASPFFAFDVHQYIPPPSSSRYRPVVSQVNLAPDQEGIEDSLLKSLVGTVWLLSIQEEATPTSAANEVDVMQVATDRDGEETRKILFQAWKAGHMIGTWCRVILTHRDALSALIAGGTVDPLLSHASDSIVDGNRWLDVTRHALKECATAPAR